MRSASPILDPTSARQGRRLSAKTEETSNPGVASVHCPHVKGPFRSWKGLCCLTDLLPAWPCACRAGSGSGRCGASDGEVPGAAREIQRRKDQEEGWPSVDAVRA